MCPIPAAADARTSSCRVDKRVHERAYVTPRFGRERQLAQPQFHRARLHVMDGRVSPARNPFADLLLLTLSIYALVLTCGSTSGGRFA